MNNLKLIYMLILVFLIIILININCEKKPTSPVRNNPFDIKGVFSDNIPPVASFTVTPDSGITNETTFTFDASASVEEDHPEWQLEYRWDWENDGKYDLEWSINKTATHKYTIGGGNKTIKLEVKGLKQLTSSDSQNVFVNTYPVASFIVTPDSGDVTDTFNFNASACSDFEDDTSKLEIRWDWDGDGTYDTNYSTNKKATHQFEHSGIKNVVLQVKDSGGLTNTENKPIKIIYEDMVYIPAGEFKMGSTSGNSEEQPEHTVYLDDYYIDKYEVTNEKYVIFLNEALAKGDIIASSSNVTKDSQVIIDLDNTHWISYSDGVFVVNYGKENYPVARVSWYGANAYAKHYGKRLPYEAEWEKAARGTDERLYPWGNDFPTTSHCNFRDSNLGGPIDVGSYSPLGDSPYGCCDMAGNLYEWCYDYYSADYYSISPTNNPHGPTSGGLRIWRGGDFGRNANDIRCISRNCHYPSIMGSNIGFRCVRSP